MFGFFLILFNVFTGFLVTSSTIGAFGLDKVEFEQYLGKDTTQLISTLWEQVQAA